MPQDAYHSLLIQAMDKIASIKNSQIFLRIAIEQLENPDDDTLSRVDLLLATFLEDFDFFIEEIDSIDQKRKQVQLRRRR